MSLKEKTQSLFANAFGYPATHTIQAPVPREFDW